MYCNQISSNCNVPFIPHFGGQDGEQSKLIYFYLFFIYFLFRSVQMGIKIHSFFILTNNNNFIDIALFKVLNNNRAQHRSLKRHTLAGIKHICKSKKRSRDFSLGASINGY